MNCAVVVVVEAYEIPMVGNDSSNGAAFGPPPTVAVNASPFTVLPLFLRHLLTLKQRSHLVEKRKRNATIKKQFDYVEDRFNS